VLDTEQISDAQLVERIANLACLYRQRFRKSLGVTAEIGEYKAAKLLNLKLEQGNINKGFDARDAKGNRVQIKTRVYVRKSERTGLFNNCDFDYALLVLLSNEYEVIEIHRAERKAVVKELKKQTYSRPSIPINRFKKIGKPVYRKD
jgi:hypothetical protein